jgi:hypothetical protein
LNSIKDSIELSRGWTGEELHWHLSNRNISHTLVFRQGKRVIGLLNYLMVDSISIEGNFRYALMDNVHIRNLTDDQKKQFLFFFLNRIKEQGLTGAIYWNEGYLDERVLLKTGFMKLKRPHYQSIYSFRDEINVDDVKKTYLGFR